MKRSYPQIAQILLLILSLLTTSFAPRTIVLAGVAGLTGGWTEFLETPEQADEIYSRIFSDINQRFIVGYYSTNKERDGKRRKIEFQVKGHPEYQVYGRRSYFRSKVNQPGYQGA